MLERVLAEERPHVVAVQELSPNAAEILEKLYPHTWLDARDDKMGIGMAASNEVSLDPFPLTLRYGVRAVLAPPIWEGLSTPIEVITVHLRNPLQRPFRVSSDVRRSDVDRILAHARKIPGPRVVMGDFNATPRWDVYRRVTAAFMDAPMEAGTGALTWAPSWWMPRLMRIDHIMTQGVVPIASWTRRIRNADHSAVLVDLDLAGTVVL